MPYPPPMQRIATLRLSRRAALSAGAQEPCGADRVAMRDGASFDVDFVLGETELAVGGNGDRSEGLLDLDAVDVHVFVATADDALSDATGYFCWPGGSWSALSHHRSYVRAIRRKYL